MTRAGNIRDAGKEVGTAFDITPSDGADLAQGITRGLYLDVSGSVKVDMADSGTVTFVDLAAGICHPLRVKRVYSTGTDADLGIKGLQ